MKNILTMKYAFLLLLILTVSCSDENKTDDELLENDKKELIESLDAGEVAGYKFGKILIRATAIKDSTYYAQQDIKIDPEDYENFAASLENSFIKLEKLSKNEELSVLEYISLYRDYKKIQTFIMEIDEDIFPTLVESLDEIYGDTPRTEPLLTGIEKKEAEAFEHAVLSAIVMLSKDLGKEISLYECSKTQPEFLPDSELKTLIQYFRGFIFFEKKLFYLSEDEITRNIEWLDANKDIDLLFTRSMFKWGNLDNGQTHIAFHSMNHLFRGFDRLMMDREIDEKRALEDFEIFLSDSKKLGLDNEIIWSVETYLYLKNGESEKAITSLQKLKTSAFLSNDDKENIDKSIEYLNQRDPEKVLNGFYDKYFLSKIATKYIFSILAQVDWEKVLKDQNVPHTREVFMTIENLEEFIENLEKYTSTESLKEAREDIKDKGKSLWNKAKEFVEEDEKNN